MRVKSTWNSGLWGHPACQTALMKEHRASVTWNPALRPAAWDWNQDTILLTTPLSPRKILLQSVDLCPQKKRQLHPYAIRFMDCAAQKWSQNCLERQGANLAGRSTQIKKIKTSCLTCQILPL